MDLYRGLRIFWDPGPQTGFWPLYLPCRPTSCDLTCEEPGASGLHVVVDPGELRHQRVLARLVPLDQHQLELAVHVLNNARHLLRLK